MSVPVTRAAQRPAALRPRERPIGHARGRRASASTCPPRRRGTRRPARRRSPRPSRRARRRPRPRGAGLASLSPGTGRASRVGAAAPRTARVLRRHLGRRSTPRRRTVPRSPAPPRAVGGAVGGHHRQPQPGGVLGHGRRADRLGEHAAFERGLADRVTAWPASPTRAA